MRPRSNLEYLGNLAVVLATVITLALLGVAGAFKIGSAELIAQVSVLQDSSRAAPRGFIAQQVTVVLAADLAPDDASGRATRAQLLDHRSDRLLEVTAVVALLGMLSGLVVSRAPTHERRRRITELAR